MRWFHTIALPLATILAVYLSVKRRAPAWKHAALVGGCALMLAGLWIADAWSTALLFGGGALFLVAAPRGLPPAEASRK